jgi:5'-AMP-activated protein kinase catalytic alpha subunit
VHQGHPPRYPSFQMKLPILFLPWDQEGGVMCLLDPCQNSVLSSEEAIQDDMSNLGVCRCGVVKYAKYFQRNQAPNITYDVALKIMDKTQLELQKDDIFNEIRVMAQLQPAGFYGAYSSPHISQWECSSDNFNEYIAMDLAANGSLIMYSQKRLRSYKVTKFFFLFLHPFIN